MKNVSFKKNLNKKVLMSLINVDNLFSFLEESNLNARRKLIGAKIEGLEPFSADFSGHIYEYKGEKICHHKFDFTLDGPRCKLCNAFCLLSEDGEIISGRDIRINSGKNIGRHIVVIQYDKEHINFGEYKPVNLRIDSHFSFINNIIKYQIMKNNSCTVSHEVLISSILNTYKTPDTISTKFLGVWVCDKVNLVYYNNIDKNIIDYTFDRRKVIETILSLIYLCTLNNYSQGDPDHSNITIQDVNIDHFIQKDVSFKLTSRILVKPSKYSSYRIEYNGRNLFYVDKDSDENPVVPYVEIGYIFNDEINSVLQISESPCMENYLQNRILYIKLNREIIEFIKNTGINLFPGVYLYIYLTIFLLNKSFYEIIKTENDLLIRIRRLFLSDEDFTNYLTMIRTNLERKLSFDEIIQLIISSNIRLRLDSHSIILNFFNRTLFEYSSNR